MKKIDLNKLEGRQIATDNEPEIPYADIEMIALKVNEIIDMLDGLTFEKKEEQKPFSVDNPPLNGSEYWYIENDAKNGMHPTLAEFYKDALFSVKTLSQGNCFRTQEEAEAALSRVLQALKS